MYIILHFTLFFYSFLFIEYDHMDQLMTFKTIFSFY